MVGSKENYLYDLWSERLKTIYERSVMPQCDQWVLMKILDSRITVEVLTIIHLPEYESKRNKYM